MSVIGTRSAIYLSILGCRSSNSYQASWHTLLHFRYTYVIRAVRGHTITLTHTICYKPGIALVVTQGKITIRQWLENWLLPGTVGLKCTISSSATTWEPCKWLSSHSNFQAFWICGLWMGAETLIDIEISG